ncbi:MAG: replicative DNA helicase [Candidatus Marinimicrobia bacterium]|nr:replicative DNA helicase [Candidatus Neomarinimicrobiota bacterium]
MSKQYKEKEKKPEFVRVPPHSDEAEISVLGGILISPDSFNKVATILRSDSFYKEAHRTIYRAMEDLDEEHKPIDQITVTEKLNMLNKLEEVGGAYYITGLAEAVPSAANIVYWAEIVKEKSIYRNLIIATNEIQKAAYDADEPAHDVLDKAEAELFKISQDKKSDGFADFESVLGKTFQHLEAIGNSKYHTTGVPTGIRELDDLTSGFQRGDLVVLAGRPSMGKTALALSMVRNAAVEYNVPVAFFSLEMPDYQLALRLLCAEAQVNAHEVRTGTLPKNEYRKLTEQMGRLASAPIFIDDSPGISMLDIRSKSRRLKQEHDIQMIVVDYLQLIISAKNAENRQQEITQISRSLKMLAKELDLPVLALSQLSRAVEQRTGDHRPQLSDLRESGAIEQDADVVMFVYRPIVYARKQGKEDEIPTEERGKAEIIVGKQRNGPVGIAYATFIEKYARFASLERFHDIQSERPGF